MIPLVTYHAYPQISYIQDGGQRNISYQNMSRNKADIKIL